MTYNNFKSKKKKKTEFTLSLEDTFLEKPQRGVKLTTPLSPRLHFLRVKWSRAGWQGVKACVMQGSVVDPFLLLIYVNDLEEGSKSSVKLFADDTLTFPIVKNPTKSINKRNSDLKSL